MTGGEATIAVIFALTVLVLVAVGASFVVGLLVIMIVFGATVAALLLEDALRRR